MSLVVAVKGRAVINLYGEYYPRLSLAMTLIKFLHADIAELQFLCIQVHKTKNPKKVKFSFTFVFSLISQVNYAPVPNRLCVARVI